MGSCILHEDHSTPSVAATLDKVGSCDEKVGRTGIRPLFEHLMFWAPRMLLWCSTGARSAGGTTTDRTTETARLYEVVPSNALPLALGSTLPDGSATDDAFEARSATDVWRRRRRCDTVPYEAEEVICGAISERTPYSLSLLAQGRSDAAFAGIT